MFFIKIKLKGYLKNINENKTEIIDTTAIKKNNIISYKIDNILHKITILNNKIVLTRSNEQFSHQLIFEPTKEYITEYYIKELNTSINIKIKTNNLIIENNRIIINYRIIDSEEEYLYLIEMSD